MKEMNFDSFEKKIGIDFADKGLLKTAFTHRSYLNENKKLKTEHNERLEFLGDAVLELLTTEFLFKKYPHKNEGDMTLYRSALVNAVTLAGVAERLGMNDYMLLSKGEAKDTGRAREVILANAIEALIGALYLDGGYAKVGDFVSRFVLPLTDSIVAEGKWMDAKSKFQEKAQEIASVTPSYETVRETGPDHDKHFTVAVFLGREKAAEGEGKSKQEAEQDAAANALEAKRWK
ncbi:MAG: ribonuclease III [Candidatus Taylorbacteria bacterium RIFCSPHIGHO2_02_FULL_47_18]|uniref:Ribonuclease 3 n=1 Tax=Candidatus Taylorbacteria bacterium RIFCSPLOWO2_01_FULL_48_100 TaxID=1802322 RepID=A0A1G2NG27_9BACT|nr:MAG: ribonuclease III [Candidatus Taylorbacteria bacterium RIFCSPHIGHO2_01_FULL_48_38]OHA27610.1 MAG: ribonuclease III [Candidatus Taylorbacteria bacterium RIFCSPHIGHO2_02_FULL_47_18]OHA34302.1 MAG: ribonuclease III [Candidatus Taylorbacteria bacterium RIFCSPLOWO2_01_FULL_48_100]OHA40456.1 MAG: ribonuclease III [Candidatus Taylorbacteria bacterium RIFCSPLOWO2_02_FULL_48_16]OHA44904.1 MAG: ribonuclease III [Candidatus Taylorbacteria bacterium RIFCSPLOWO2_12_FULL_48_11]